MINSILIKSIEIKVVHSGQNLNSQQTEWKFNLKVFFFLKRQRKKKAIINMGKRTRHFFKKCNDKKELLKCVCNVKNRERGKRSENSSERPNK